MPETINEDGTPVLIESVYYRYNQIYSDKFDSIEEALQHLEEGEDYGALSSVGVFVDGKPHTPYGVYSFPEHQRDALELMKQQYALLPKRV